MQSQCCLKSGNTRPAENLLEDTDGVASSTFEATSRGGSLLPSVYADVRLPDDVITF